MGINFMLTDSVHCDMLSKHVKNMPASRVSTLTLRQEGQLAFIKQDGQVPCRGKGVPVYYLAVCLWVIGG